MVNRLATAVYLVLSISLVSCGKPAELRPPHRPAEVPIDAVWAGGADGGAYIKCTVDAVRNVDRCSIWNDFTGKSTEPEDYMLLREHRAATDYELQYTGAANDSIFLQHGMILRRR
jgi:hypothetical protein